MEKEKEKKNKKRGFIGRLLVFLLSIMAIVGLVAMVLSVLNVYVDPQKFVWFSFFGLAFWEIFLFNAVIFILLLLLWSNKAWIALLALLAAVPGLGKSYSFGKKGEAQGELRVMSYNLHNFKHIDGKTSSSVFADAVVEKVKEINPDVLCCQEFSSFKEGVTRPKCIEIFAQAAGFQHVYYNLKRNYGGNVVFSKYPLSKVQEDSGFGQENTYGIMVSVDAGDKGIFHVANIHLLSYKITDDEIDILMESAKNQKSMDDIGKSLVRKLKYGFEQRSEEMVKVLDGMPDVDGPVIVCGDFNEPPMSYNYCRMRRAGFSDSFLKVGRGIKPTYAGRLPLLRIDYIWTSADVTPTHFKRLRYKISDHYPVVLDFNLNK